MICYWFPEPTYFFFAEGVPELLYYSHFPTTIIALLLGIFVFFNARHLLPNRLLFLISIFFSVWTLTSLILWTRIDSEFLIFIWTIHVSMFSFIAIYSVYFIYAFLRKEDVPYTMKLFFALLLAPFLIFAPSDLNLTGFDFPNSDAFIYECTIFKTYYIALAILAMVWILVLLFNHYREANPEFRKQIVLMGAGIEFFLFISLRYFF